MKLSTVSTCCPATPKAPKTPTEIPRWPPRALQAASSSGPAAEGGSFHRSPIYIIIYTHIIYTLYIYIHTIHMYNIMYNHVCVYIYIIDLCAYTICKCVEIVYVNMSHLINTYNRIGFSQGNVCRMGSIPTKTREDSSVDSGRQS